MRFTPTIEEKKGKGEGNPNWIGARFELTPEQARVFHQLREESNLTMNQLVKQMVIHCIDSQGKKEGQ